MMDRLICSMLTALLVAPPVVLAQNTPSNQSTSSLAASAQEAKITTLISEAERHFQLGETAYKEQDFEAARGEFDQAIDTILAGKIDMRSYPRLRAYFLNLVERINGLEVKAIASGGVVREQRFEPALHDELAGIELDQEDLKAGEDQSDLPKLELEETPRPEVRQFIHYFTQNRRGRATMARGLQRSGRYMAMAREIFQQERVPLDIVWLAQAESNWQPVARSWAGAVGIWQFVSWRGNQYGLTQNEWIDLRCSFEQATRASARYLRFLYDRFLDWKLAMAAYNCGEGRVDKAIASSGYADFWYLREKKLLPKETRNYIPIILAIIIVAKDPAKYGFDDVMPDPPLEFDTFPTQDALDLRLVAEITNTPYEVIEGLNPELKRGVTPPNMEYGLRLPRGSKEEFVAMLDLIPEEHRDSWRVVRVKDGESLSTIAEQHNLSVEEVASVNNLDSGDLIGPGSSLILPLDVARTSRNNLSTRGITVTVRRGDTLSKIAARYGVSVHEVARLNNMSTRSVLRVGQKLAVSVPASTSVRYTSRVQSTNYRVRRGDTLSEIARRFGVTVSDLKQWNGLGSSEIQVGQRLVLRSQNSLKTTTSSSSKKAGQGRAETYRVRSGDTLYEIAQRFGVSVTDLKNWNGLRSNKIQPGQQLKIYR